MVSARGTPGRSGAAQDERAACVAVCDTPRTLLADGRSGCFFELSLVQLRGSFGRSSAFLLAAPEFGLFWSTLFGSSLATCRYIHD